MELDLFLSIGVVLQVGKGRDVGLNQIAAFEAKVASGNGEQTLSRDFWLLYFKLSGQSNSG
jgi:hypothetical protein